MCKSNSGDLFEARTLMGAGMGRIRKKKIDQLLFLMLNATLKYVADEFAAFLGTNEQVKVTFASNILYLVSTPQKSSLSRTRGCRCLCEASHIETYVLGGGVVRWESMFYFWKMFPHVSCLCWLLSHFPCYLCPSQMKKKKRKEKRNPLARPI